jgi:hypothetical protein
LVLWFFCRFLGNASEFQSLFKQVERIKNQPELLSSLSTGITAWGTALIKIWQLPLTNVLTIIFTLLLLLLIILIIIWLAITSQIAIIKNSEKAEIGKDNEISFKNSWREGTKSFWPALGLNVLAKAIIFLILSLLVTPLLTIMIAKGSVLTTLLTLITIVIFGPLAIIITFVTKYAVAFVVLQKQKFWEAFRNGWRLFAANWLISIEMALIVLVINCAVTFLAMLAAVIIISPFIIIGLTSAVPQFFFTFLGMALIIGALAFFFCAAVFSTWQNSAWTLLFMKLNSGGAYAKIVRWVAGQIAKKENK